MEEKYIDVNGIRTRYLESGSGEAMLLVHGGDFGRHFSANDWSSVIDSLGEAFHVFAIDKIGAGFTDNPKSDGAYIIGTQVQHAYDFLQTIKIDKAHLVGHSRGAYTTCRIALEQPETAKTLIIVSSRTLMTPPNPIYDEWNRLSSLINNIRDRYRYLAAANSFGNEHITEEWVDIMIKIANQPKIQEANAKMGTGLKSKFKEDLIAKQKETHEWIKAGKIKVPTFIVWGANDPSAPLDPVGLDAMRLILPNVAQSEMHVLNRAGHYCYREQPKAFVTAVTDFIKLNTGSS